MGLTNFRIVDMTFVGASDAWAIGTADCLSGSGRCPAMARTTDGRHWHSMNGPGARVAASCIDVQNCVSNLRFASATVGYAFGPETLFMTADGGTHWEPQPGGAEELEALDGNVIRVVSSGSGCPGPCVRNIETAPIGSADWSAAHFSPPTMSIAGVSLARTGSHAYVLVTGNPAGGAGRATSHLYVSADDGRVWTDVGEPCPQLPGGGEVDGTAINTASDGTVVVGCLRRQQSSRDSVALSTDGGDSFRGLPPFTSGVVSAVAAASGTNIFALSAALYASLDGGRHFTRVQEGPQHPTWLGFETDATGHAVEQPAGGSGGSILWQTTDGGRTWTSYRFP